MRPRVTAILVARDAASHLPRTLEALAAQTRPVDRLIAVDLDSSDSSADLMAAFPSVQVLSAPGTLSFGQAIEAAIRVAGQPESDDEWLWLLAADNAPDPDALAALLGAVEVAPSVAVAGPKQMSWDDPAYIHEFGETITTLGASVPIIDGELDQAQHDNLSDVLAVAAGGMLVRHRLWRQLGGFDPGLPAVDDALDFCVRVRLAGHRVQLVPSARIASAGERAPGTAHLGAHTPRRRRVRLARTAQLHRRLAYAPAVMVVVHWLSLLPLGVLRALLQMVRKHPTAAPGEVRAALAVAFSGRSVPAARRRIADHKTVGWSAIAPLRQPLTAGRRRRMLAREQYRAAHAVRTHGIAFFSTGGAWVVLGAIVLAAVLFAPLLGATAVRGGPLLPLSPTVGELWSHVGYGYRDTAIGLVGPADPFAALLAVLGTLTFWEPSSSIVYLFLAALPLAALGAWFAATRLTARPWLRALAALLWVLAPSFLVALQTGRLSAVLAHLMLPWLFFAGLAAARSWSASAATALLFAAIGAAAPSLIPPLLVVWLLALATGGRRLLHILAVPVPLAALFAPLVWFQASRGDWLALLADPGVPVAFRPGSSWSLAIGYPAGTPAHLADLLAGVGLAGADGAALGTVLIAPLVLVALATLLLPGAARGIVGLVIAVLGFATAVLVSRVFVAFTGSDAVAVWPGSALSLAWLGLVGAAIVSLGAVRRGAIAPALAAAVGALVLVLPVLLAPVLGTSVVRASDGRTLPAFVTAEAVARPGIGTLVLRPTRDGGLAAELQRGSGDTLDEQTTLTYTATEEGPGDRRLGLLAVNLGSRSGLDASPELDDLRVGFVLLEPASFLGRSDPRAADQVEARVSAALDENPLLTRVGDTSSGVLWRYPAADELPGTWPEEPGNTDTPIGLGVLTMQALVFGLTLLLAIPTGGLVTSGRPLPEVRRRTVDADTRADDDAPRADDDSVLDVYVDEPTGQALEPEEIGDIPQVDDVPPVLGVHRPEVTSGTGRGNDD
ncbi:glycosyltransferase family 2 protein [Planctomonas deserti]|uniref:glycosyltransferase family 2 protein n=1 Tax=Planctomonas deserti TaxID=2144185 RepID=UPI000D36EC72|nr:glycosyltransferase family 2 protein [Planctomonas deserti]